MKKCQLYCISSKYTDKVYIGTTCDGVKKRISHHKFNGKYNGNCYSREITKYKNWEYHILEEFEYDPKDKLNMRKQLEYYYINGGLNTVNKNSPIIKPFKTHLKEYGKKYYKDNVKYFKDYYNLLFLQ